MEIAEYKNFLASLDTQGLKDYLYEVDLSALSVEERAELDHFLADMKVRKIEKYLTIFGFLMLLAQVGKTKEIKGLVSALGLTKPSAKEIDERPFDLVWVAQDDACDECAAEDGKIYGKTTDKIPTLHPYCMCKFVKKYREKGATMKAMNMRFADGGAVRAIKDGDKKVLEVLAAPYGSATRKDRLKQFFSVRTDFMIDIGDRRPTMYLHGFSPRRRAMNQPPVLGIAEVVRVDEQGLWMRTELDNGDLSRRVWEAAKLGKARASSDSIAHLARPRDQPDGSPTPGEVTCWPIAAISVFDGDDAVPVSDDAVVIPIRALFEQCELDLPETFEAGEATGDPNKQIEEQESMEDEMKPEELQAAIAKALADERELTAAAEEERAKVRKSILDELKEDPKYRAIFNVRKEISGMRALTKDETDRGMTVEDLKETHEFVWMLRHPNSIPAAMRGSYDDMFGPEAAYRVLEESEALEAGAFVPEEMLNDIIATKDEVSLVSKLDIFKWKTERLIFNVPTETVAMTALALIVEEGAYVANEPAFVNVPVTVGKYGSMVTCTEEMLEDQNVFERFFVKKCGRMWGLAENTLLHTLIVAGGTVGVHIAVANTPTDPEFMTGFFAMAEPWREGAHIIMNNLTMGYMRALLIATPRAYGDFPTFGGGAFPNWMGHRVHLNSNWPALAVTGDTDVFATMLSPEAFCWVERRALSIFVDPYGDRANGRIRYFPSTRFCGAELHALGNMRWEDHA